MGNSALCILILLKVVLFKLRLIFWDITPLPIPSFFPPPPFPSHFHLSKLVLAVISVSRIHLATTCILCNYSNYVTIKKVGMIGGGRIICHGKTLQPLFIANDPQINRKKLAVRGINDRRVKVS